MTINNPQNTEECKGLWWFLPEEWTNLVWADEKSTEYYRCSSVYMAPLFPSDLDDGWYDEFLDTPECFKRLAPPELSFWQEEN